MMKRTLHRTSILKSGVGPRIYLMFAGRRNRTSTPGTPAKSDGTQQRLGMLLVAGAALLIGIVLWSQIRMMF